MLKLLQRLTAGLNQFWFAEESTLSLGIFRIVLGLLILWILLISHPNWDLFYGAQGSYPFSEWSQSYGQGLNAAVTSILSWSTDPRWLWTVYGLELVTAVAFILGFQSRVSTILMFFLWASLFNRNLALVNGQDQIIKMMLFFACFAPMGNSLSLDRWLWQRRQPEAIFPDQQPRWSWRLMQVSMAILYIFAGPAKLNSDIAWRDGTALYYVSLSDRWYRFFDVDFLHGELINWLLTYGTITIQILFPYLVWFKGIGDLLLAAMTIKHIFMVILLSPYVTYFNLAVLSTFILFVRPTAWQAGIHWTQQQFLRWFHPVPDPDQELAPEASAANQN